MLRPFLRGSSFSRWSHHMGRRNKCTRSQARIERILNRLPNYLRPFARDLNSAPFSHVISFLILHELTAILPLCGLTAGFHYTGWSLQDWVKHTMIIEGVEKFGKYFRRKQWFGFEQIEEKFDKAKGPELEQGDANTVTEPGDLNYGWGTVVSNQRFLIQVATAYAITKILLPVRIVASIWMTPWFARKVIGNLKRFYSSG